MNVQQWLALGEYDCSICGACNTVSRPLDINSVELTHMAYEVDATQEYLWVPLSNQLYATTPPTLALVVDVSKGNRPALFNFVFAVKEFLRQLDGKDFFQILLVTFDKYVHYYDLSGEEVRKVVMVDEPLSLRDVDILEEV